MVEKREDHGASLFRCCFSGIPLCRYGLRTTSLGEVCWLVGRSIRCHPCSVYAIKMIIHFRQPEEKFHLVGHGTVTMVYRLFLIFGIGAFLAAASR